MSTIDVANITDGTDTVATSYVLNGSAKAWVNFNGTGTVAIRDSVNVGSITDNGTGDYAVNFSSSFANVNHAGSGLAGEDGNFLSYRNGMASETVSKAGIATTVFSGTRNDQPLVTFMNYGDLA